MNRHSPPLMTALAAVLTGGVAGVAQAAPTAPQPQPSVPTARDGKSAHSFYCNMDPASQDGPVTSVDRTPASGDDKDKDKGGGKKAPISPVTSSTGLKRQTLPSPTAPQ